MSLLSLNWEMDVPHSSTHGTMVNMSTHSTIIKADDSVDFPFLDMVVYNRGYRIGIPPQVRIILELSALMT